jgi:hypothetical protein
LHAHHPARAPGVGDQLGERVVRPLQTERGAEREEGDVDAAGQGRQVNGIS